DVVVGFGGLARQGPFHRQGEVDVAEADDVEAEGRGGAVARVAFEEGGRLDMHEGEVGHRAVRIPRPVDGAVVEDVGFRRPGLRPGWPVWPGGADRWGMPGGLGREAAGPADPGAPGVAAGGGVVDGAVIGLQDQFAVVQDGARSVAPPTAVAAVAAIAGYPV